MKHVEAVGLLKDLLLAQQLLLVAKCNPELLEIAEHSTALWVTRLLSQRGLVVAAFDYFDWGWAFGHGRAGER
jgi:hypothetical protein